MRRRTALLRWLLVPLAALLVAQLAPPAAAADEVVVDVVAVTENSPFTDITIACLARASAGATATTIWCDVWDNADTSISHTRIYPGSAALCYFKANQLHMPLVYCVRATAQFAGGGRDSDEECHEVTGAPAPRPPTTARSTFECLEPTPLPV